MRAEGRFLTSLAGRVAVTLVLASTLGRAQDDRSEAPSDIGRLEATFTSIGEAAKEGDLSFAMRGLESFYGSGTRGDAVGTVSGSAGTSSSNRLRQGAGLDAGLRFVDVPAPVRRPLQSSPAEASGLSLGLAAAALMLAYRQKDNDGASDPDRLQLREDERRRSQVEPRNPTGDDGVKGGIDRQAREHSERGFSEYLGKQKGEVSDFDVKGSGGNAAGGGTHR